MMLPVLTSVLALETGLAILLISKVPPLEKLACMIIDLSKTQRGSAVVKTLALTLIIFLASSVSTYVSVKRQNYMARTAEGHVHIGEAQYFVLRTAELESAITGFILVLAVMINRTHYYLRGKRGLTVQLEVLKKQSKGAQAEYLRLNEEKGGGNGESAKDIQSMKEVIGELREKLEKSQRDVVAKEKEAKAAEANAQAIRKQQEGMATEHERLLEENENLRTQISSLEREYSGSANKKDS